MPAKRGAVSAITKIERSQLSPGKVRRELMGDDLPLSDIVVYIKSKLQMDWDVERIIDIQIQRDIDAASTLTLTINDYDRSLLHSRRLHNALDIQIDGIWFRLVKVERQIGDDNLKLTFEQREIAILRSYPKKGAPHNGCIFADRSKTTRAEFVLRLIREVKEFNPPIAVVIPDLHHVQPIQKRSDTTAGATWGTSTGTVGGQVGAGTSDAPGIPPDYNKVSPDDRNQSPQRQTGRQLMIKYVPASPTQIKNVNTICSVGQNMKANRKVIVTAIMTAIQESVMHNDVGDTGGKYNVGLYHQQYSWGSYADRHDPATATRLFMREAIKLDKVAPDLPHWELAADVQRPDPKYRGRYAEWRWEAERLCTAYGIPAGANANVEGSAASMNLMGNPAFGSGSAFLYYRGTPAEQDKVWKREDSWTCIRRLADEVGWRAFFVSGVFYFINDEDLFKTQPIMQFDESTPGIDGIGFDIDVGKKTSEISVQARTGRWLAPPGAVVLVQNMGPANGRWLVHQFSRSIFDSLADITCAKPQAQLPEPLDDQIQTPPTWANVGDPFSQPPSTNQTFKVGTALVKPIPAKMMSSMGPIHETEGLPGYPATDYMAAAGTPVLACESGTIRRFSGHPPTQGPVSGVHGPFGWSIYLLGDSGTDYYYTHLGSRTVPLDAKVTAGKMIGTVGDYARWGGANHVHLGVHPGPSGHPDNNDVRAAPGAKAVYPKQQGL